MIVATIIILFLIIMGVFLWRKQTEYYQHPSCIITMTTYMGFQNRFQTISLVLDPLVQTRQEIIVINEWDENNNVYIEFMRKYYPQVHFIQKTKQDQGQARSLNILIRDYLLHSKKKYWIHWEDTWLCTQSLYPDLVRIMEKNPTISQLQVTDDWKNISSSHKMDLDDIHIIIPSHQYTKNVYEEEQVDVGKWPLFSLRPSINRLSFFQRHGTDFYFLEDPYMWPLRFEWEFGRIFLRNKGVKAVTKKNYAKRLEQHTSTYSKILTDGYSNHYNSIF